MVSASEVEVDGGGYDQREHHGGYDASDYGDGEGLQHLGAGSECQCKREHSCRSGDGGHEDGAQAAFARFDHGVARRVAFAAEALIGVEEQDTVFGHDTDYHDESHEGRNVERGSGDQEREEDA